MPEPGTNAPPKRVLIIDDDPVFRRVAHVAVGQLPGVLAEACASAEQALQLVATYAYDLLILDVSLPGMDGNDFHRLFVETIERTRHAHLPPTLVVTGTFEERLEAGLLFGEKVAAVLRKPVPPDLLRGYAQSILAAGQPKPAAQEAPAAQPGDTLDAKMLARLDKLGGPALLKNLSESFLSHVPELLEKIETGVRRQDFALVEDAAHSLKSSAGILGAARLLDGATRLERFAREGRAAETAQAAREVQEAFERIQGALAGLARGGPA
ncbi:MAG: response regulator [Planctomycetota bacterium]|nr:response regulator [Planctomycetota bacterium]